MNDIAHRLRALATSLEKNAPDLDHAAFVKKVATFNKALASFEKTTAEAVSGLAPGQHDLERLMTSPDKKVLTEPVMKRLYLEVLRTKAPAEVKAAPLIKQFIKSVKEQGIAEPALAAVKAAVAKAQMPVAPPPKDKEALQAEMLRLGGLDDEAFAEEMDLRYKRRPDLNALLKANAISQPKSAARPALLREFRKIAQRASSHQLT